MEPLSARIPSDLYLWLAKLRIDDATTNSDKLRVLLGQLKRQDEGAYDYVAAHAWARELTSRLRQALVRIEGAGGAHSDVLSALIEYNVASLALLVSQVPTNETEAKKLEDTLVKRSFALFESLLRQATTDKAAAYDPPVVRRHLGNVIELARALAPHPQQAGA